MGTMTVTATSVRWFEVSKPCLSLIDISSFGLLWTLAVMYSKRDEH